MFDIKHPVGWNGVTFVPCTDPNLHHIMTYTAANQNCVSVILHWNDVYDSIPQDVKYGFAHRHYHLKMSIEEAISLRDALNRHIVALDPGKS